jgi:hypothetical protein
MSQWQRFLAFFAATAALGLAIAVLGPRLLGAASGPEVELVTSLKLVERKGVSLPLGFGRLSSTELQYQRLSVTLDALAERAMLTATLDFTGTLERPGQSFPTRVSSLGLERIQYVLHDGDWVATGSTLERLRSIVVALEARRQGLETAPDSAVSHRVYRAEAWFIRSEREEVLVSEDWRLQEDRADRPLNQSGTTRLTLVSGADGGFMVLP